MTRGRRRLLVAAGVVAGVGLACLALAPRWLDARAQSQARRTLLAFPVYQVLDRHEHAVFERLVADYALVLRDRMAGERFADVANAEIATIATQRIAHASDDALLALMRDMLEMLRVLRARSPQDCYRYLFPKVAGPAELTRWFDRESQARTLDLMAEVIRTAAEHPVEVPPRIRVEPLLGPVINDIYAQFGENTRLISRAEEPGVNRETVCAVSVTLYEKVMALPPADAAAIIRTMTQL